jgi:predicted metal-binding membrane protein
VARQRLAVSDGAACAIRTRRDVMLEQTHVHDAAANLAFVPLALMWFVMMSAMMAPTAWPWIRAFHRFSNGTGRDVSGGRHGGPRGGSSGSSSNSSSSSSSNRSSSNSSDDVSRSGSGVGNRVASVTQIDVTGSFAAGYLIVWLAYSIAAAVLQRGLHAFALLGGPDDVAIPIVAAIIFLIAGLYQFAPLKRACLTHCRTPIGYFLTRWHDGPIGPLRMGLHHGLFCVGCCWALMATMFAVGVMNVWWMLALGAIALLEQVAPYGNALRRALGGVLLLAGVWRLVAIF